MSTPEIQTTTVGSYSPIDWLAALPSEQAVLDATAVVTPSTAFVRRPVGSGSALVPGSPRCRPRRW